MTVIVTEARMKLASEAETTLIVVITRKSEPPEELNYIMHNNACTLSEARKKA